MQLKLASAEKNKKTKLVTAVTTKSILHSCLVQYYLTINQSNVKIKMFLDVVRNPGKCTKALY